MDAYSLNGCGKILNIMLRHFASFLGMDPENESSQFQHRLISHVDYPPHKTIRWEIGTQE